MKEKILVIVPAYNEEESIIEVMEEIRNYFPEGEILLVDDGSIDKTTYLVKDKVDFLISLPFHLGLGVALQAGYIFAKQHGYDYVVHFDADGQHVAEEIPKLLQPLKTGECDLALGSRYLENSGYKLSFLRKFASKIISRILYFYLRKTIKDPTSGFRAMNKGVINLFTQKYPYDYPEIEEFLILTKYNLKIKEIPVRMRPRTKGKSSFTFGRSLFYIFKIFVVLTIDLFWLMRLNKK
ncbi:MAG: glycosyltransferase family 2 protein [Candidatus Omnitrophica bacterium]|nr:glycosyltransferase family 2 protein [Candidatus Omnitrophota bacterium]